MTEYFENNTQPTNGYVPPVISIDPEMLNFGDYNPNIPLLQQPFIILSIRNQGGGLLTGRIITQVSWLIINPIQFKCKAGETSEHALQLSTGAPQNWNQQQHKVSHAVIISSNAGAASLDVQYSVNLEKKSFAPSRVNLQPRYDTFLQNKILVPIAILVFLILLTLAGINLFGIANPFSVAEVSREELLTQGAQTIFAEMNETTGTPEPENELNTNLLRPATATSLSLFAPLKTETPDLTATAFQPTFTPWPLEAFDHPEAFVKSYFQKLTEGNFQESWKMLTRDYQEECCSALGTDPYYIYARDWEEVEKVTLITAYLQDYVLNPAPVQVRYQIKMSNEEPVEFTAFFWLIVDESETGLLIDNIDVLEK